MLCDHTCSGVTAPCYLDEQPQREDVAMNELVAQPSALTAGGAEAPTTVLVCRRDPSSGDPVVTLGGKTLRPGRSQEVRDLSREGFGWGYYGAAPAQLALAVLLEFTSIEAALRLWPPFRNRFLAPMRYIGGEIPTATIRHWLEDKRAEEPSLASLIPGAQRATVDA